MAGSEGARSRRSEHVIASEAIQSPELRLDCFVASAPRNDGEAARLHTRIPSS
jgi:hypothetical protein